MAQPGAKTKSLTTDRIEKEILLRAPRGRVWRALTDVREFNAWFGIELDRPFAVGQTTAGRLRIKGYEHITIDLAVVEMTPEHAFSYRWHPYPMDPKVDYALEPTTLCEFRLEDAPGGTRLTIVESGFDQIPASRRAEAYRMNEGGWPEQLENIARHVAQ
jgi:uncharacterized protein YndB with AHSA1/START domain